MNNKDCRSPYRFYNRLLFQYMFHTFDIIVNIVVPKELEFDIIQLNTICGVGIEEYTVMTKKDIKKDYLIDVVKVPHSEHLVNGSYGFVFKLNNKLIIYTGDCSSLEPFNKYIDECDELYVDTSYTGVKVHVAWNDLKNNLPKCKKIYLMHLDDEESIRKEVKKYSNVEVVSIYER